MFEFITDCTRAQGPDVSEMIEHARQITWRTFFRHVPREAVRQLFPIYEGAGLTIETDYAVSVYRSEYKGRPCYYILHSLIEYIFQESEA